MRRQLTKQRVSRATSRTARPPPLPRRQKTATPSRARWDEIGRMFATAMMNACWLLNPEALVIGGGVARAGDLLFTPFREHLLRQLSGPFRDGLAILPAAFGHEAGTVGAAALALEEAGF